MGTTWAGISWSDTVVVAYSINTHELRYHVLESYTSTVLNHSINNQLLLPSNAHTTNITNLLPSTFYLFAVRPYTVSGNIQWRIIINQTLPSPMEKVMTTNIITNYSNNCTGK